MKNHETMSQRLTSEGLIALMKKEKNRRRIKRLIALLSAIVLLITINAMKFDAVTLERVPDCGYDYDHTHGPECYDETGALTCGLHEHTDACYQTTPATHADPEGAFALGDEPAEGETAAGQGPEAPLSEEGSTEEAVYTCVLGAERVPLSEIIRAARLPVDISSIELVGPVEDRPEDEGYVGVEAVKNDWVIFALKDFDRAELAIITAEDLYVVELTCGAAPAAVEGHDATEAVAENESSDSEEATDDGEPAYDTQAADDSEIIDDTEDADDSEIVDVAKSTDDTEIADGTEAADDSEIIDDTEDADDSEIVDVAETADNSETTEGEETAVDTEPAEDTEAAYDSETTEGDETAFDAEPAEDTEAAYDSETAEGEETAVDAEPAGDTEAAYDSETTEGDETAFDAEPDDGEAAIADAEVPETSDAGKGDGIHDAAPVVPEYAGTIDLQDVTAPYSLKALMAQCAPAVPAEADKEAEAAIVPLPENEQSDPEAVLAQDSSDTQADDAAGDGADDASAWIVQSDPEAAPSQDSSDTQAEDAAEDSADDASAWIVECDEAVLSVMPGGDDWLIEVHDAFERTWLNVTTPEGRWTMILENGPAPEYNWPAQDFDAVTDTMHVIVNAPVGAFPEGTTMQVEDVQDDDTLVSIAGAVEDESISVQSVHAVDITFRDSCGRIIEPACPISVRMILRAQETPEAGQEPVVVHMDDAGQTNVVTQDEPPVYAAESIVPEEGEATVAFTSDAFSVYAVVMTTLEKTIAASDGNTYRVGVTYGYEAAVPEGAQLLVREILPGDEGYDALRAQAEKALGRESGTTEYARLFDIHIADQDGDAITIQAPVSVSIDLMDASADELSVVHFGETTEVLDASLEAAEEGRSLSFETGVFSVYAIVGTTIEKNVLASNGHNYRVTVSYGPEAGIPFDADLSVEELLPAKNAEEQQPDQYQEYASMVGETLGWEGGSASYLRLFDIKIVDKDDPDVKYQPAKGTTVDVRIELADKETSEEAAEKTQVVHIADGADAGELVETFEIDGNAVNFKAEGFSAYAIVEGPEAIPIGWHKVESIEDLLTLGSSGVYIGHPDGYYYGNTTTGDSSRTGITKTKPAQSYPNTAIAAKYYFEPVEGESAKVFVYCYAADGTTKQYVYNNNNNSLSFVTDESQKTAFTVTKIGDYTFKLNNGSWYWNMQGGTGGTRFCSYNNANDGNNQVSFWYYTSTASDPYKLDNMSYGLMFWDGGVAGKALMAESGTENTLDAKVLPVMSTANNSSQLFVPNDSDISMWTFHWKDADHYYLSAVVDGSTRYLKIDESGLSLVSAEEDASLVQVVPGTGIHAGEICLKSGNTALTFMGTVDSGFSVGGDVGTEWLHLVELSELTSDYFLTYSASKISVSDESITNGSHVVVYTRYWNEEKLRYDYYAISSDGKLVPVYESGDTIEWNSGQLNTLLWNFVEYYWEGTTDPNFYYELYNQYSEKYIAPQVTGGQILSDDTIGINLNGRRDGQYYSTILAWDEDNYSYVGLKVENGQIVTCPKSEAMDFYFAVMQDLNVDDTLTTIKTVDHTQYGITMKIKNFSDRATMSNFLGNDEGGAVLTLQQGLLSSSLGANGYPTARGGSLGNLFSGAQEVNHLFIESSYSETGYFAYDSVQNFASLNGKTGGDFTVYKELGTYDGSDKSTLKHGQFLPFNDLKPGTFATVNGKNLYSSTGQLLSNSDPRKYEQLYNIEHDGEKVDCYFGVELEASFAQTPSGLDAWGHDIIFEFTGDDDFWLYVDGELVIDLGGIHSAVPGSVNFRTGEVNVNGTHTTLRDLFYNNYLNRDGHTADEAQAYVDSIFVQNSAGQWVFRDNTNHTMKVFYMERGAGASNLKMRFNLAAVKRGTVQLSKSLSGVDEGNIMAEFPYQIWYTTTNGVERRLTNAIMGGSSTQNDDYVFYKDTVNPVKYLQSAQIGGQEYQDVFFLKPGETADINFPELQLEEGEEIRYRIVECGVNTEVYSSVTVNGAEIEGTPVAGAQNRSDFGIGYDTTDNRPKVDYVNAVDPDALRTLTIQKRLYDETGENPISYDQDQTEFTFRLYLSSEFDELDVANMHTYHVKDVEGYYCTWDAAQKKLVRIGAGITNYSDLSEEQKVAASFTTSIYGSIGRIPNGYTVEVRDLLAGTQYRVEERPGEIPDGYSFQRYDEFDSENAGIVERGASAITGVNGTIVSGKDAPVIVRNLKGWGLRMNKVWRDKDYMSDRDATYFALFTGNENGLTLVEDSVRQLPYSANPQTLYWYYDHLPVQGTNGVNDYFIREVTITGNAEVSPEGVVTGYETITPIQGGGSITLSGTQKGETTPSDFTYSVQYATGESSSDSNVRVDTVTNDRPGIILRKENWNGEALAGATFTLEDNDGNLIGTFTSDSTGMITTAFLSNAKEYTLTETKTPQTWHGLETDMKLVWNNGAVTVEYPNEAYYDLAQASGTTLATLTIKNQPFTLKAVKLDGDTRQPLQSVTFQLHRQHTVDGVTGFDPTPLAGYENLVTDKNGVIPKITETLPAGTYELREKKAKSGYEALSGHIHFTISDSGIVTLGTAPDGVTLTNETADDDDRTMEYVIHIPNHQLVEVTLIKQNDRGQDLKGARFQLCKFTTVWENVDEYSDIDMTQITQTTLSGLTSGRYRLAETKAPDGYVVTNRYVYFNIAADPQTKTLKVVLTDEEGTDENSNSNASASGLTITVKNIPGTMLPATGASGTAPYTAAGLALMALAAAMLLLKRRSRL